MCILLPPPLNDTANEEAAAHTEYTCSQDSQDHPQPHWDERRRSGSHRIKSLGGGDVVTVMVARTSWLFGVFIRIERHRYYVYLLYKMA